ncbi:mechanosensitive ion channel [Halobacteria archaeon AArc-dxtr1]|nr:mechanosensitive ion channel [Halobacteria archaeon AArc-dxtr1]
MDVGHLALESAVSELVEWVVQEPWLLVPLLLAGSYLLAKLVYWASKRWLAHNETGSTSFRRAIFEEIHTPISVSIGLLGIYLSLAVLDLVGTGFVVVGLVVTALTVLWARTAVRIGNRWIEVAQAADRTYEFAPIFKNAWTIGVSLAAGLVLISVWEIELTPFLASAGVLGIVIGFAAQDAISNLIGGVSLYVDNTYKVGDVIQVEDDQRGTVTDVGIRSTTVLTTDNRLISVPNAVLNSSQVVNETSPQRHVRIRVPLTAAYGTDYRRVEEIVLEVCADAPLIRESPKPRVLFDEFGDSALVFEVRAYISHPLTEKQAVNQLNRGVYDRFAEAGITIPFPQREISYLADEEGGEQLPDEDKRPPDEDERPPGIDSDVEQRYRFDEGGDDDENARAETDEQS